MIKLFRACELPCYTGPGSVWAFDLETARAYTEKGVAHGGPNIISVKVDMERVLNIYHDTRRLWLYIRAVMGDEVSLEDLSGRSGRAFPYTAWEDFPKIREALKEDFDWIIYEDDYPEGAIVAVKLSDGNIDNHEHEE